jgi:hypothetical protein
MFIGRLIDQDRRVLGWNRIPAETRGDGGLWPTQNFLCECEEAGVAVAVIWHWVDVHAYMTRPLVQPLPVTKGLVVTVPVLTSGEPLFRIDSEPEPLPGLVMKQSVTVGIGPGRG